MAIVAYGQGYTTLSGMYLVKELLELRLVSPAAARDFRERIEAGWGSEGKAAMQLFNSAKNHLPLTPPIRECQDLSRAFGGKGHHQER